MNSSQVSHEGHDGKEEERYEQILSAINVLNNEMKENFSKLYEELSILRHDVKLEVQELKDNVKDLEKSLNTAWCTIEDLKDEATAYKSVKKKQQEEIEIIKQELSDARKQLNEEREKNIALENYTRKENLKFMNIPESEDRNVTSQDLIYGIIGDDLEIDTSNISFHAVHRIGKKREGKARRDLYVGKIGI